MKLTDPRSVIVIPARVESTRLPRKLLLSQTGKPLLQHTWEAACKSQLASAVFIAAGDDESCGAAARMGARCVMPVGDFKNGTARVAAAVPLIEAQIGKVDIVVNLQGDEPEIGREDLDRLIGMVSYDDDSCPYTLCQDRPATFADVKAVVSRHSGLMFAAWFTRLPTAPTCRDIRPHVGAYAFSAKRLASLPLTSNAAERDSLEQLAWLEQDGAAIGLLSTSNPSHSINLPSDYAEFVERWKSKQ